MPPPLKNSFENHGPSSTKHYAGVLPKQSLEQAYGQPFIFSLRGCS